MDIELLLILVGVIIGLAGGYYVFWGRGSDDG